MWVTASLDIPASRQGVAAKFWAGVTGSALSRSRGCRDEFATLVPPDGDAYLSLQRTDSGPAGVHLDLHAPDGAFEALRTPAGWPYCLREGEPGTRPLPRIWAAGHASLVDQISIDIPAATYESECEFWADRTGWDLVDGSRPEFRYLVRPVEMPLRIMLQRLDSAADGIGAHLDVATSDRAAETDRHRDLGARVEATKQRWTVLRDPAGARYCITERDPYTGVL